MEILIPIIAIALLFGFCWLLYTMPHEVDIEGSKMINEFKSQGYTRDKYDTQFIEISIAIDRIKSESDVMLASKAILLFNSTYKNSGVVVEDTLSEDVQQLFKMLQLHHFKNKAI